MADAVRVGAVLYDPRVSLIWDVIADFFNKHGLPMETVLYRNYALQVDGLLKRQIDVAWNSPLAWLDSQLRSGGRCRAIAMRDTDRDRQSLWVVRADSGVTQLNDLKGKTVAVGAQDSPQATLIPLSLLAGEGLTPGEDVLVKRFDVLRGTHGDHIGGEMEALKSLSNGQVQATAMLDLNWDKWTSDGTIDPRHYTVLAKTDRFDHCVFTVRDDFSRDLQKRWLEVLFSMSYENPQHREMMDMEGLKQWLSGRTTGYGPLQQAVERSRFFEGGSF